jgi:hypothetical protein
MKNIVLTLCIGLLVISSNVFGQDQNLDLVKVQVVASGKTESEAITEALRSALTQTSSVFISSNITLINDELEKDQIAMINNGSIAEYKIIDKTTKEDGTVFMTCNVTVSVNKLGSFVESSGGAIELKGGLFANNIKLMDLNKRAEEQSIQDLLSISRDMLSSAFDYEIINGEPKNNNGKWQIPLTVQVKKNANYAIFTTFFYSTLKNIGQNDGETESYMKLNIPVYSIGLFDNSRITTSTPVLKARGQFPKQTNFQYYTRVKKDKDVGELTRWDNYDDFSKFLYERNKLMDKVDRNNLQHVRNSKALNKALSEPNKNFEERIFTSTPETRYDHIVLRSKKSYDSLSTFILGFSEFIQNAEMNNGVSTIRLSELRSNSINGYKMGLDNSRARGPTTFLPISFCYKGGAIFLPDFRDYLVSNSVTFGAKYVNLSRVYLHQSINEFPYNLQLTENHIYGKNNATWEEKMLVQLSKYEWVTVNQCDANSLVDGPGLYPPYGRRTKALSEDKMMYYYFEFVFASYIKFFEDLEVLEKKASGNIEGFPLQLTLVGNDQDIVLKMEITNSLTLDEISKVQKYTIQRVK